MDYQLYENKLVKLCYNVVNVLLLFSLMLALFARRRVYMMKNLICVDAFNHLMISASHHITKIYSVMNKFSNKLPLM